jgi:hypothetical protein
MMFSGLANSLSLVVFGRVVAGIGGAGANALVSLIILGKYQQIMALDHVSNLTVE